VTLTELRFERAVSPWASLVMTAAWGRRPEWLAVWSPLLESHAPRVSRDCPCPGSAACGLALEELGAGNVLAPPLAAMRAALLDQVAPGAPGLC
jgi:hypothetical protein